MYTFRNYVIQITENVFKKNRFKPCGRGEGNKGSEATCPQIPLKILREDAIVNKVAIYSKS